MQPHIKQESVYCVLWHIHSFILIVVVCNLCYSIPSVGLYLAERSIFILYINVMTTWLMYLGINFSPSWTTAQDGEKILMTIKCEYFTSIVLEMLCPSLLHVIIWLLLNITLNCGIQHIKHMRSAYLLIRLICHAQLLWESSCCSCYTCCWS